MNDSRVEWLRRRVTKSLEISNKMFDDMVSGKTYVDVSTVGTPFGPQYPDVCDYSYCSQHINIAIYQL